MTFSNLNFLPAEKHMEKLNYNKLFSDDLTVSDSIEKAGIVSKNGEKVTHENYIVWTGFTR